MTTALMNKPLLNILSIELNGVKLLRMIDEIQDYAIILLDVQGNIQNWNAGAARIKGYAETEILGKNFEVFYIPEERATKPRLLLKTAAAIGRAVDEGWRQRKDGTRFWGSITITAVHDDTGALIGFGKVTRDLTDSKKAQMARLLELRNKELSEFNYIASHDLQEPLRTVINYVHVINEDYGTTLNAEVLNYLNTVEKAAGRMSMLIQALLHYSQLGKKADTVLVDCNVLVKAVVEDLNNLIETTGAKIEVAELPTLKVYSVELRQLFQNLLINAIKFSRKGVAPQIKVTVTAQNSDWLFAVHDNGIGIEQKHYARIFSCVSAAGTRSAGGLRNRPCQLQKDSRVAWRPYLGRKRTRCG